MSVTSYHIQLKGFVGGEDFARESVDDVLNEHRDEQVNVLIDSTGGSLATGISISASFKQHGKVNVHFVGLNASAATIASLGAAHISIDAGAMYLVHKCSLDFFRWGCLNADQFEQLIADCEKVKADLDKLDQSVARLYASRCKRKAEELLDLMKVGGWLTPQEALDWGFVDEITDLADDVAPELTDALASALASAGLPLPNIRIAHSDSDGMFAKFIAALTSFFKPASNHITSSMLKTYNFLSAILADKPLTVTNGTASVSVEQLDAIENVLADKDKTISEQKASLVAKDADIKALNATIAELQAKLDSTPAASTTSVVEPAKSAEKNAPKSDAQIYCETINSARKLFNLV